MRYNELPVKYLQSAEELLIVRDLPDYPDWTHNPYMPIVKSGKIEVARLSRIRKGQYRWEPYEIVHAVDTDAWWMDNEHTVVAIRCKWVCAKGDVWWKKNGSSIWFYQNIHGIWQKRKHRMAKYNPYAAKAAELVEAVRAFEALDW